jgi:hypothetical protein
MAKDTKRRIKTKDLPKKEKTLTAREAKKVKGGMELTVRGTITPPAEPRSPSAGTPKTSFGSK